MQTLLGRLLLTLLLIAGARADVSVTVDDTIRHQTIDGFGTCLAWWLEKPYSDPKFRELYYRDLGCSILRMEFHPNALEREVTLSDDIDANIRLFNFKAPGVKVFGEFAQAGMKLKLDEFKLIGSLWTPPHWMKTGATLNKQGQSCGGQLKMGDEDLLQFARYVAAFCRGFEKEWGVPVYAISIQNELRFREPYNSCVYTPAGYAQALAAVAREFKRCGITTRLIGPEDVGVGPPGDDFFLKQQMSFIDAARQNKDAWSALEILAIHGYSGDGVSPLGSTGENWAHYWDAIKPFNKRSWQTEASGQSPNWTWKGKDGDRGAFSIAVSIHEALVRGNVSAWLYWQLSDGARVGAQTLARDAEITGPKYAVARHFFRFVRPGSVRVDAKSSEPLVMCSAFLDEARKGAVCQLINASGSDQVLFVKVPAGWCEENPTIYRSGEKEQFVDVPCNRVGDNAIRLLLPAGSIATIQCKIR